MATAILHVLGTAQREGTGIASIVAELARGLDSGQYEVHACFLGPPGPLQDELRNAGARVSCVDWTRGARDLAGAWRFLRCLRCLRGKHFAIVHQHQGARAVRLLVRAFTRARLVVHQHGRPAPNPALRQTRPHADALIAVSHEAAANFDPAALVVHTGVEPAHRLRNTHPAAKDEIVIGTLARFVAGKGLVDLLEAFAMLRDEFPRARLELAGDGTGRRHIENAIARLGIRDEVTLLGWVPEPRAVLRTWDVFAFPSREEGLPVAVLEAMAEGLPVVATTVGGVPELVEDGRTGYLVAPGNVGALAESLRRLMRDPSARRAMGSAGWSRVHDRFHVARMVTQMESIYRGLCAGRDVAAGR